MQDPHVHGKFANFYNDVARYPPTLKYRRFGAQWSKLLNDSMDEVLRREEALNHTLSIAGASSEFYLTTVLDCPRRLLKDDQSLRNAYGEYEQSLRLYTQDLCLVAEMYRLKDHHPFFAKQLNKYQKLFHGDRYGPTGEHAATYQDVASPDFCVTLEVPATDIFTNCYINLSDIVEEQILKRIRNFVYGRNATPASGTQTSVQFATIVSTMDYLTCFFVPILFTGIMFALVSIRPYRVRIAVGGGCGLAFAVMAKVATGKLSRGDIFAYTAAYFAVASVYIGSTGDIVSGGD